MSDTLDTTKQSTQPELLTNDQLKLVEKFREETQNSFLKLVSDLSDMGNNEAGLAVFTEMSSLTADILYLMEKHADENSLKVNKCKTKFEFREVLFNYCINRMMDVIDQYEIQEDIIKDFLNKNLEMSKTAVKH